MEAAEEEPEDIGREPKEPRTVVDKQYLVVLRHGQRIDEVPHGNAPSCHGIGNKH